MHSSTPSSRPARRAAGSHTLQRGVARRSLLTAMAIGASLMCVIAVNTTPAIAISRATTSGARATVTSAQASSPPHAAAVTNPTPQRSLLSVNGPSKPAIPARTILSPFKAAAKPAPTTTSTAAQSSCASATGLAAKALSLRLLGVKAGATVCAAVHHGRSPSAPTFTPKLGSDGAKTGALHANVAQGPPTFVSPNWIQNNPNGSPPAARDGVASVWDPAQGYTLFFGGCTNSTCPESETWALTTQTQGPVAWTQLSPTTVPPARANAMMAFDAALNDVVMFGGGNTTTEFNDTWAWTGTNWVLLRPSSSPPARYAGAMTYDANSSELVLFGGHANASTLLQDTWVFTLSGWAQESPAAPLPSARYSMSLVYDPASKTDVMFGGYNSSTTTLNDTWTFNGSSWTQATVSSPPSARGSYAMAYDPDLTDVIMFGGSWVSSGVAQIDNDTWAWTGSTWESAGTIASPGGRSLSTLTYDSTHHNLILFAGITVVNQSLVNLGDTWTFNAEIPVLTVASQVALSSGTTQITLTATIANPSTTAWTNVSFSDTLGAAFSLQGAALTATDATSGASVSCACSVTASTNKVQAASLAVPANDGVVLTYVAQVVGSNNGCSVFTDTAVATNTSGTATLTGSYCGGTSMPGQVSSATPITALSLATLIWSPGSGPGPSGYLDAAYDISGSSPTSFGNHSDALPLDLWGGLTDTKYQFDIYAFNATGFAPPAVTTVTTTPLNLSAPTSVSATPADANALITWSAPLLSVPNITEYTVTAYLAPPGGANSGGTLFASWIAAYDTQSCSVGSVSDPPIASATAPCQTLGLSLNGLPLQSGTTYYFTVSATTLGIPTGTSQNSPTITPAGKPFPPTIATIVNTTPAGGSATVTWTAPPTQPNGTPGNNGSPMGSYTITASPPPGSTASPETFTDTNLSTLSAPIGNLYDGTAYTFTVTATNPIGTSNPSQPVIFTPAGVPFAPIITSVLPGAEQALVFFTPPPPSLQSSVPGNNGSPIIYYTISVSPGTQQHTVDAQNPEPASYAGIVSGLTNGVYSFTVTATNGNGTGAASFIYPGVVIAGIPTAPIMTGAYTFGSTEVCASWQPPQNDNGSTIWAYTLEADSSGAPVQATVPGTSTSGCIGALTNGVSYSLRVGAESNGGPGPFSSLSNAVTPIGSIDPPIITTATADYDTVNLIWEPPATFGGAVFEYYEVYLYGGSMPDISQNVGTLTTWSYTGLPVGQAYGAIVQAVTSAGVYSSAPVDLFPAQTNAANGPRVDTNMIGENCLTEQGQNGNTYSCRDTVLGTYSVAESEALAWSYTPVGAMSGGGNYLVYVPNIGMYEGCSYNGGNQEWTCSALDNGYLSVISPAQSFKFSWTAGGLTYIGLNVVACAATIFTEADPETSGIVPILASFDIANGCSFLFGK